MQQSAGSRSAIARITGDARSGNGFDDSVRAYAPDDVVCGIGKYEVAARAPGRTAHQAERDVLDRDAIGDLPTRDRINYDLGLESA